MPRRPPALLPRLLADCVLPCAVAAMALAAVLVVHQLRQVDEDARLRTTTAIDRLEAALLQDDGTSTRRRLDAARLAADDGTLRRVELRDADGQVLQSGAPTNPAFERYRRELPAGNRQRRSLIVEIDPGPQRHERQWVTRCGVLIEAGIAALTLLSALLLRRRVLLPLRRLQQRIDALRQPARTDTTEPPEACREFARLHDGIAALAGELAAQRAERAAKRDRSTNDALEQLRQNQAALRSKAQFVALVGHHFRQPTQALQLIAASLHPGVDAEQQALLAQMRDSVDSMARLLDALLEIARLDAGVVAAAPAPFTAAELFLRDRATLLAKARQRRVELRWHGCAGQLYGDIGLAAALLYQLADNGTAHAGAHRRVLVCARPRRHGVRIEVRDNGPGIAAIHQQRIFDEFVQLLDVGNERDSYGLGLAIAARLARVLGTQVGLRSRPGRGSVFWFDLPRVAAPSRGADAGARGGAPVSCPAG